MKDKQKKIEYSLEERIGHKVIGVARKLGIILRPLGAVIVLMPPLSITKDELKELVEVVRKSIDEVC